MDKRILWIIIAVLVIGLAAIFYPRPAEEPSVPLVLPEAPVATAPAPEPDPEPAPAFVAEKPAEPLPPLPALDESDADVRAALAAATSDDLVERHLVTDGLVRKLVTTVDNLSGDTIWMKTRVVPHQSGPFLVEGPEDERYIAPANYERYAPLVQLVAAMDAAQLAAAYQRHYPLLQEAYEELGYPGRQFHNRALEIIDHLLATPVVEDPIRVVRPHVVYKYADPELEALSSGQKTLIRIGPDNAAIIREKLIELRAAIEGLADTPRGD
ncbi:MAG: DUF3014 domain-containing protein [Gammaproteobacteria bacterium]